LNLRVNAIGNEGALAVISLLNANESLQPLNISSNHNLSLEVIISLAQELQVNNHLTSLDIGWIFIDDDGVIIIADALKRNTSLTSFSLDSTSINEHGAMALASTCQHFEGKFNTDTSFHF
jgi:NLR family CARD domain-containing protein 3